MKTNVGSTDRIIRLIISILFLALYFTNIISGTIGFVLVVLAVVFLLTSFISFCPLYWMMGINSQKRKKENA